MDDRLERQISFLLEVDRLKEVVRRSYLASGARLENSAEHSWHVALAALVLGEHARGRVDLAKVVAILLVHDLVEVDAGDTYIHDVAAAASQHEREATAADRIFALLPDGQGSELRALWEEYEAGESPEARFAVAVDRLLPLLHNAVTGGRSWREHGVDAGRVSKVARRIEAGSGPLWEVAATLIAKAVGEGSLAAAE